MTALGLFALTIAYAGSNLLANRIIKKCGGNHHGSLGGASCLVKPISRAGSRSQGNDCRATAKSGKDSQ
jgi:hypothetical protein